MKRVFKTYRKEINHSVHGMNSGVINDLDYLNADAGDTYSSPSMTPVTIPEDKLKNLLNQNNKSGASWTNPNEQIGAITGDMLGSLVKFGTPSGEDLAEQNAPDYWMPTQSLLDSFRGMFYPTEDVPQECQPDSEYVSSLPDGLKDMFRNPNCPPSTTKGQQTLKSNKKLFITLGIGLAVVAIIGTIVIVNSKKK